MSLNPIYDQIIKRVGFEFEMPDSMFMSPNRSQKRDIMNCRKAAILLCHLSGVDNKPGLVGRLAEQFNTDHSNLLHGLKQSLNLYDTEKDFRVKFNRAWIKLMPLMRAYKKQIESYQLPSHINEDELERIAISIPQF